MSYVFETRFDDDQTEIKLFERKFLGKRAVPVSEWRSLPEQHQPGVRPLLSLVETQQAFATETSVVAPNSELLDFSARSLTCLGLPDVAAIVLRLDLAGRVESPDGAIKLVWQDALSRTVNPRLEGVLVHAATKGRLSGQMYRLLRAVAAYNKTRGQTDRISSWTPVQELLGALTGSEVRPDKVLDDLRIHQAGAFSLDVRESIDGPVFDPVLMGPTARTNPLDDTPDIHDDGLDEDVGEKAPLLRASDHRAFIKSFSADGLQTRPAYAIARNTYVVMDLDTRAALDVVKRLQRSSATTRRAFIRNPRSFLVEALPDLSEAAGRIFVETAQYSERVKGLGLWEKPNLSWLARKSTGWLPEGFILRVGEKTLELDEAGLNELAQEADRASEAAKADVAFRDVVYSLDDVKIALDGVRQQFDEDAQPFERPEDAPPERDRNVLLIDDHIEDAASKERQRRRMELPQLFPSDLVRTTPKRHQQEGFKWLVMGWAFGFPGLLLADDMGLGKTMQALSFLAWFRANRASVTKGLGDISGPILIVAPTALLRNWQKEAETHLVADALGDCLEAFGPGLRRIKAPAGSGVSLDDALDIEAIREADWILTTYETLANYHRVFGRVRFSIVLFDEMQKIKAPDTINTHAAKTLNADFVIGLTGTPIENRIEDLWCIMDRVSPGFLGGLKAFSKAHGGEDPEALKTLKDKLDTWVDRRPPVVLRRMKVDHIEGLPKRTFDHRPAAMPKPQADAYEGVVRFAQQQRGNKNAMLKIIHDMRGISLHPDGGANVDASDITQRRAWISASARVAETFSILRHIEKLQEKILVFIEDRAVQATFAHCVAEEFKLPTFPQIINGELDGEKRQAAVDRFQSAPPGFGLMILSPKAAGIGLTITAANHVIHLSRWWNPAVEDQCNDRVFRIGQDKPVTVYIPIARHPVYGEGSFDIKLNALLERKRTLSRDMLVPPVWETDIDELFSATMV
ncbi:DEAD/DEAH box helicase [Mesorhizobium sp.]|uniref:DEAD/DEAH box helicase n=3 Tax=unclassified Mesorhizobium TaxID=325217 RepID=UPI000FEA8592|nr:DEAD/DEAH box helicase [Mesorhizobium sp.]RWB68851.1 MAG: DEAD/DEAH box helicase [Mesorhizobium sp.]RWF33335.1 MAG: DEAD/DEAH box helicase [Mesorhizobium sp.]TIT08161.1 MAG: DEAD/DEAH box helicase [Mesorhizobium sp.]TIV83647.1 MAG: DEAD/DEAH box helicase [Mesorhizobium sp.]